MYIVWVLVVKCVFCSTFPMSTASQQALKHGLSLEVDRLGELIDKLENKVSNWFNRSLSILQFTVNKKNISRAKSCSIYRSENS